MTRAVGFLTTPMGYLKKKAFVAASERTLSSNACIHYQLACSAIGLARKSLQKVAYFNHLYLKSAVFSPSYEVPFILQKSHDATPSKGMTFSSLMAKQLAFKHTHIPVNMLRIQVYTQCF